jgi:hypothetical protein
MALARWQNTIVNERGAVQPGAFVEVRTEAGALAMLFADRQGATLQGNPFAVDAEGSAAFHVAGGAYRITAYKGSFQKVWRFVPIGTAQEHDLEAISALMFGSSSTSVAIGTGSKNFTAESGRTWQVGTWLIITSAANPADFMNGQVTAYNDETGALTVDVVSTGGSGTRADWTISLSGPRGATGATGATGAQGPTGPAGGGLAEVVDDTSPQLGADLDANGRNVGFDDNTGITDDSGNEQLLFHKTASAVNQVGITNAATGNGPQIAAEGGDTNIDLNLASKGSGAIKANGSPVLKAGGGQQLSGGFNQADFNAGTKSSGTFTPDPANGNFQRYTNGGAHTLAPPSSICTMILEVTNSSAGAITTSGFSIVSGDAYSSSGTKKHLFYITKTNSFSHLHVVYVTGT